VHLTEIGLVLKDGSPASILSLGLSIAATASAGGGLAAPTLRLALLHPLHRLVACLPSSGVRRPAGGSVNRHHGGLLFPLNHFKE